jgi:hypothetical protein
MLAVATPVTLSSPGIGSSRFPTGLAARAPILAARSP